MKISKKNLAAFVRNHAYGEEIIHGGGKVETIKSIHVEFMLGMAVGEIRLVNGDKYTLIPVTFIPDEKTVIIESEEEFEKFINIFFSVQQRNSRHPLNNSFKSLTISLSIEFISFTSKNSIPHFYNDLSFFP